MILRLYLFGLYSIGFLSAALIAFIIFNTNPFVAPFWMLGLFYLGIFLLISSILAIIGYYLKVWATNREIIFSHLIPTLRQAIFIGIGISGLLFFQQIRVLNWWIGILFCFSLFMVELFFRSKKASFWRFYER